MKPRRLERPVTVDKITNVTRISPLLCILIRRNFSARLRNAVKVIRALTQEMTSPSLRALKAVTRAMFPPRCIALRSRKFHRRAWTQSIYDNGALCREDDSQRIFPGLADTGIVGLARLSFEHIYRAKLLWRINHTSRILANFSDKLRISTDILAILRITGVTNIICTITNVTRKYLLPRKFFHLASIDVILRSFLIERQGELFVIISSTVREYRYYPPFLERKKLSQLFVNPRERYFSRLRSAI